MSRRLKIAASFAAGFFLAACAFYAAPKPQSQSISESDEVRIGREFRREARKRLKLIHHPEIELYVNKVGRQILSVMGPLPYEYRFFVVEDRQLNAFAVPGGNIYVHSGLLERVRSSDELAGVLGHEIIHVKGRHINRLAGPEPLDLLALLGMILGRGGQGSLAAGAIGQALAATRQLSYSRQLEMEADTLGARYMAEAGYDPHAALDFLKLLHEERVLNPTDLPPYLATHPLTHERVANAELVVRSLGKERAEAKHPEPIRRLQIILRLERRDAGAVVDEYQKLVGQNPERGDFHHFLALARESQGRWSEARKGFERARAISPESPGIDRDLARLYIRLEEFGLAREALQRSTTAEPKEPLNYLLLGELFEKESKLSDAAGAYLRAHHLFPLWPEPSYRMGVVYGKMERLGDAYYYLGRSHLLRDEDEKAVADWERAIKALGAQTPRAQLIKEELDSLRARRR